MHHTKLASIQLVVWRMLEKYNQDPVNVFKKVLLDPVLMHQPGARYPLEKIAELWEEMSRRIKDPCFGLIAATCWHPSHFGILGHAMLVSCSLRITLERLIRFHRVISDANFGKLQEDKNKGTLVFTLMYNDEKPYPRAREDAALAWIMSVLRMNFQRDLSPVSVSLTHSRPVSEEKYYDFFKSPVTFNAPVSSFSLPLDVVDLVLPTKNDDLAEFSDQLMAKYIASLDNITLISRVKKIIAENLPSGNVTLKQVAFVLCLSARTLQRLLKQEATSFISLLNETRMDLAKQYVRDKNMDMIEIAFLLGFAEQCTFSRSFKRWIGQSPSQYRKNCQINVFSPMARG
jgi:AraC-like DNA-binding protein